MKKVDLAGKRYGILTIMSWHGRYNKTTYWLCKCDCGIEKVIGHPSLFKIQSCGCKTKELISKATTKHGFAKYGLINPIYGAWRGMKKRCYNPNGEDYKDYGGKGIIVCDEWLNNPQAFYDWGFSTYKRGLSLDRIKVHGNYEPSNCRWTTRKMQAQNRGDFVKLNNWKVRVARKLKENHNWTNVKIAKYFNIKQCTMSSALNYKTWKTDVKEIAQERERVMKQTQPLIQ